MEYNVRFKNAFSHYSVIEQLQRGGGIMNAFGATGFDRPFISGTNHTFSPNVLERIHHVNHGRPPVYETADFALHYMSSLGGLEKDYYRINQQTLIYDRRTRWGYWEHEQKEIPANTNSQILDGPLDNLYTNSPFGKKRGKKEHGGTDYPVPGGTKYYATAPGIVVRADFSGTFGNVVIIDHGVSKSEPGNVYTVYAHCSKLLVKLNQRVKTKDVVGLTGNTGTVYPPPPKGYHGHYEVICTTAPFGTEEFYLYKYKHKPTDLRILLTGK